ESALSAGPTNGWTARTQEVTIASSTRPRMCITQYPSWRTLISVRRLVARPTLAARRTDTVSVVRKTSEFSVFVKTSRMDGLEIVNTGENAVSNGNIAILPSLGVHP